MRYTRDQVTGDGSSSEDGWASVEVASRAIDMERGTNRGRDRGGVYDVITNGGGYGRSGMRTSRRLKPRYSGYASESDL